MKYNMKRCKAFFESESFRFICYCIEFFIITLIIAKYVFIESQWEYVIFMIFFCPFGYWLMGKLTLQSKH